MSASHPDRLLLADDDPSFREMTRRLLLRHGYDCDTVANAAEVEARLRERSYDLLISDIEMPGNSNLQMIAGLPQLQAGLPVILVTGSPSIESAARSVGLAVAAYLIKPVDAQDLLMQVARAIERFRCFRAVAQSRQRFLQASADLERLGATLCSPAPASLDSALRVYFDLTLENAAQSILELRRLLEVARGTDFPGEGTDRWPTAAPAKLVEALWETIAVLEKTKTAFKSKDLAQLRQKLEDLVGGRKNPRVD